MFPSDGLVTRHPLSVFPSLRRVAAGGLPRFQRYYEGAVTSCRPSRRASFPSLGGTTDALAEFAPGRGECAHSSLELVTRYLQPGYFRGDDRISYVLGEPRCAFALLSDPGRADPIRPLRWADAALMGTKMKAPTIGTFEAESHSFDTRCLRFAVQITHTPRKTRFGCWPSFTGGVGYPLGFLRKVSASVFRYIFILLSQTS